jgi:hypothetical protein
MAEGVFNSSYLLPEERPLLNGRDDEIRTDSYSHETIDKDEPVKKPISQQATSKIKKETPNRWEQAKDFAFQRLIQSPPDSEIDVFTQQLLENARMPSTDRSGEDETSVNPTPEATPKPSLQSPLLADRAVQERDEPLSSATTNGIMAASPVESPFPDVI